MKRISVIIGTRPEAIKLAPIILGLQKQQDVTVSVCVTGQHTDMVDSVLAIFGITPAISLSITAEAKGLNKISGGLLAKFEDYFANFRPDVVVVQGDTVSVLSAALAAFNMQIPVAHVEAGLRTNNLKSPWPEEGYRRMVSQITEFHFAPTEESVANLNKSDLVSQNVYVTGNTVIDALFLAKDIIADNKATVAMPEGVSLQAKNVLITGHRRENFGDGLDNLCRAVEHLAKEYGDIDFVFPIHLNPLVQKQVRGYFTERKSPNVKLIEPLSYLEFVALMDSSLFIITDSGGVQEEAPSLGKPVLVTRDTTERPEGIAAGTVRLVGTSAEALIEESKKLLDEPEHYLSMSNASNPYGDGKAAARIIEILIK